MKKVSYSEERNTFSIILFYFVFKCNIGYAHKYTLQIFNFKKYLK